MFNHRLYRHCCFVWVFLFAGLVGEVALVQTAIGAAEEPVSFEEEENMRREA